MAPEAPDALDKKIDSAPPAPEKQEETVESVDAKDTALRAELAQPGIPPERIAAIAQELAANGSKKAELKANAEAVQRQAVLDRLNGVQQQVPTVAEAATIEPAVESSVESVPTELMDNLVALTLDNSIANPLVIKALEQEGIKDPFKSGQNSMEASGKYSQALWDKLATLRSEAGKMIAALSPEQQQKLGHEFYERTIGVNLSKNMNVYGMLRDYFGGTQFGETVKNMERERLTSAGFGSSDGFRGTILEERRAA